MVNPLDSYILVRHFGCTRIWCPTWLVPEANIVILVLYQAKIRSSLWLKKVGY